MRRGDISFIINVPTVSGGAVRDGNMMSTAVELNIPFVTTIRGAKWRLQPFEPFLKKKSSLENSKFITTRNSSSDDGDGIPQNTL